jgi:hypothetical protein
MSEEKKEEPKKISKIQSAIDKVKNITAEFDKIGAANRDIMAVTQSKRMNKYGNRVSKNRVSSMPTFAGLGKLGGGPTLPKGYTKSSPKNA